VPIEPEVNQQQHGTDGTAFPEPNRNDASARPLRSDPLNDESRAEHDIAGPTEDFPAVYGDGERAHVREKLQMLHGTTFAKNADSGEFFSSAKSSGKVRAVKSIWSIANPHLRELAVYQPGKPIEETARELGCHPREIIKLASNENPLGPSLKAMEAMREAIASAQLYPDGGAFYLRDALAKKLNLARSNIIVGNGSNEIIEFLAHAFLKPGDAILTSEHAFVAYKIIARVLGAQTIEAPSCGYSHDLEAMLALITNRTELIFIANPNNPTGTFVSASAIERFLDRVPPEVIVVFDEAYYEFVDNPPDLLPLVRDGRDVVLLRTFSKIHGLAGLRVGYGIARPELIEVLQKTREPFNVNSIGQIGALAALRDEEHQRETRRVVDQGRAFLEKEFAGMGLAFIPSKANFLLVNVGHGAVVFRALLQHKVIVRAMKGYNLPEWVRITIGTMEQNEKCIAALKQVLRN
jgi:histidinol-phosphate aminotransferase